MISTDMIPERVIEMVHGPSYLQLGTRDDSLRPAHTFAVGGIVHEDRQTVTVFVPIERAQRIVAHLEGNGRIALGIGQVSHEAYQIKGRYVSRRPTDADDVARQEACRRALLDDALQHGFPEDIARPFTQGFAYVPGMAITFRAEAVFLQTPGPDAGSRLA